MMCWDPVLMVHVSAVLTVEKFRVVSEPTTILLLFYLY
jgi:hypothetical protein